MRVQNFPDSIGVDNTLHLIDIQSLMASIQSLLTSWEDGADGTDISEAPEPPNLFWRLRRPRHHGQR